MRDVWTSVVEVVGLAAVAAGAAVQFGAGAGLMTAGAACVAVGVFGARP